MANEKVILFSGIFISDLRKVLGISTGGRSTCMLCRIKWYQIICLIVIYLEEIK